MSKELIASNMTRHYISRPALMQPLYNLPAPLPITYPAGNSEASGGASGDEQSDDEGSDDEQPGDTEPGNEEPGYGESEQGFGCSSSSDDGDMDMEDADKVGDGGCDAFSAVGALQAALVLQDDVDADCGSVEGEFTAPMAGAVEDAAVSGGDSSGGRDGGREENSLVCKGERDLQPPPLMRAWLRNEAAAALFLHKQELLRLGKIMGVQVS